MVAFASKDDVRQRTPRQSVIGWIAALTAVLCLVLFVWPVGMIVIGAFRSGQPGISGTWTPDPFLQLLSSPSTAKSLTTSVWMALLVTVFSKALSFYFAWLVARTNTPLRRLITPAMLIVLATPPLFFVISWGLLGKERVGLLNELLGHFTGAPSTLINVESFGGVVFVSVLKSIAFGYFLLIGPMYAMSRRMEEAAAVAGSGRSRVFWSVNVPIMAPALIASVVLGFIVGLEYFEAPLILGTPAGVDVISTQIYSNLNEEYPPRFAEASGLAVIVLLILAVLLIVQRKFLRGRSYETVEGKSGSNQPWDLGPWKYLGTAVFLAYAALALLLPAVQLFNASLQPYLGADTYSFDNYRKLFANPVTGAAFRNTILLGTLCGLAVMLLALMIIFVIRHVPRLGAWVSRTTWLPASMPGPALALGIVWILLSVPFARQFYGSFGAMFIALVIAAIPVGMRTLEPAMMQVNRDLEEAAWVSGASKARGFLHVVARLVLPSFFSGWLLSAIIVGGNLTMPLMVGSPLQESVPKSTYDLYTTGAAPAAAAMSQIFLLGVGMIFLLALAGRRALRRARHQRPHRTG